MVDGATHVLLAGPVAVETVTQIAADFGRLAPADLVRFDLSAASRLDTAGAWVIARTMARLQQAGTQPLLVGATPDQIDLVATVQAALGPAPSAAKAARRHHAAA